MTLSLSHLPTPIAGVFAGLCSFICTSFRLLLAIEVSVRGCTVMRPMVSNLAIFEGPETADWLSLSLSAGLIKQFLRDVDWGDVDYLVIDTPPGTSDEHISVVQYLSGAGVDGAVLVTTPQVQFLYFQWV